LEDGVVDMAQADAAAGLWERLSLVPDRRRRQGRQYGLLAVVTLTLAAMLSGANDLRAVFRWGRRLPPGQAMAALRNAMLHIVHAEPELLAAIRKTFAENRTAAITAAQQGFL
jgi:DDE_Tnp_1-associated